MNAHGTHREKPKMRVIQGQMSPLIVAAKIREHPAARTKRNNISFTHELPVKTLRWRYAHQH